MDKSGTKAKKVVLTGTAISTGNLNGWYSIQFVRQVS